MDLKQLYDIYLAHPVICNDTRKIAPGCIYWAIRGERFDGNVFAGQALEMGAAYAVVDNAGYLLNDRCLLVEDSLAALQALAALHRQALGIPVIAIAGSNGKTTTKELMFRALSMRHRAFATPGNLNNHIGLPLTLLRLTDEHEIAIVELGANHRGENAMLCDICLPDAGVITNIGKDHLEGFGGMEGVEKANLELFDYLRRTDGLAMVNMDDKRIKTHTEGLRTITYGTSGEAEVQGYISDKFPFLSVKILRRDEKQEWEIHSKLFGSFHLYNILAAAAAGLHYGVEMAQVKEAIESFEPQDNRSQALKIGSNTIILDAYNANPSSMSGALADFSEYPAQKKVLVLGDMFELGEDSAAEHDAILRSIDFNRFEAVALAGEAFYAFKDKYPQGLFFESTPELKEWYRRQRFEGITAYAKGSRGMKLEEVFN